MTEILDNIVADGYISSAENIKTWMTYEVEVGPAGVKRAAFQIVSDLSNSTTNCAAFCTWIQGAVADSTALQGVKDGVVTAFGTVSASDSDASALHAVSSPVCSPTAEADCNAVVGCYYDVSGCTPCSSQTDEYDCADMTSGQCEYSGSACVGAGSSSGSRKKP